MDLGTAEIVDEKPLQKKRRPGIAIGGGSPSGGGDGGGGGGSDNGGGGDDRPNQYRTREAFMPAKSRILTGFLLVIVVMTFGGLIAAYVVIATNNVPEWRPFALPVQLWISTALIILSSIFYHLGKKAADDNRQEKAKKWFIVTTALSLGLSLWAWRTLGSLRK